MKKIRNLSSYEERKLRLLGLSPNMEQLVRESWEATAKENGIKKTFRFCLKITANFIINLALTVLIPFKDKDVRQGQH